MSEYDDVVVDIMRQQESARAQAIGGFDVTADDAGRAVELGRSTGQNPNVIAADVKNFDEAHKRNLATAIIRQNLHLAQYANSDPIHSKLSQDDWGTLDGVSQKLQSFRRLSGFPTRAAEGMIGAAAKGFQKGFGDGPIGSWLTDKDIKEHPFAAAVYSGTLAPVEGVLRALSGGMHGATEAVHAGAKEAYKTLTGDEQGADKFARDLAGMAEMQLQGVGVHQLHVAPAMVEKAWKNLESTKLWLDHGVEPPAGIMREVDRVKKKQNDADVANLDEMLSEAQRSTTRERDPETFANFVRMRDEGTIGIDADAILKLYGDKVPHPEDGMLGWSPKIADQIETARRVGGDIEIPVADWLAHVDPEVAKLLHDDIRVRPGGITKNEAKGLSEAQKELDELHPETKEQFAGEPLPEAGLVPANRARDGTIYVGQKNGQHFSISEKYGEEVRAKNKLEPGDYTWKDTGFVTPEGEFLNRQEAYDWVRKHEKENYKGSENMEGELDALDYRDRVPDSKRKSGQALKTPKIDPAAREILPDDLPQMRAAGGLEPLFSVGDRKLELKRMKDSESKDFGGAKTHDFDLIDETGVKRGYINLMEQPDGKTLYIDMIAGGKDTKMYDPNFFGPSLVRSLLKQLKEEFPEATTITGHRVSGAREAAGKEMSPLANAKIKFDVDSPESAKQFQEMLTARWVSEGHDVESLRKPISQWTPKEREIGEAMAQEMGRLVPGLEAELVSAISHKSQPGTTMGVYLRGTEPWDLPRLLVSMEAGDKLGVARHEAIHHLRGWNFFTEKEWAGLERAAREEGWIGRYNIEKRYPQLSNAAKLEEAIAEGYKYWKSGELILKDATAFQKLKDFFERMYRRVKEILGKDFTWEELFKEVDEGKVGRRDEFTSAERPEPKFSQETSEAQPSPRDTFRTPAAVGMTEPQMRLYERRLREMHEQDVEFTTAKAEREQRRMQTREWKQTYKETRSEVEATMGDRPDVAADLFFARGEYFGNKIAEKVKIDPASITPEQRAALPRDYVKDGGLSVAELEDVASGFGFHSAQGMLDSLMKWNSAKLQANMGTKAFFNRMVDMETDRQMKGKLGDLEQNILEHAKDQIAGETQLNLIAEETLALGIRAGAEAPINKPEYKQWFKDQFSDMPVNGQTSDKYLRAMQKAGTAAEMELLRGNFDSAFRAKQTQFGSTLLFRDARQLEKEQKAFDKLTKKLAKRDVSGLDLEYQDVIQSLLWDAGLTSRRSPGEIQASQANWGYAGLETFVNGARYDGLSPAVPDWLTAGGAKPIDQMTVREFREFSDAIKSLNYIGRLVEKVNVAGELRDFKEWKTEALANVRERPVRDRESQEKGFMHMVYSADASLTRNEILMQALDNGDKSSPFVNAISVPMAASKHKKYTMLEELGREIKDLNASMPKEWSKSVDQTIPNDWFRDPNTGDLMLLKRSDLINIMSHWGNRSNIEKFTSGWGSPELGRAATKAERQAFEVKMKHYIDMVATRDDWKFVQKIWDIYDGYRGESEKVWQNVSGTQPKFYDAVPVDTPHGTFKGGYVPVSRDLYMPNTKVVEAVARGPFDFNYPNFNTPQGHLKERTGASYYVSFRTPLTDIPLRMQQVIHDIAYRDSVMAASKILRDNEVRNTIRNHYGVEYEKTLDDWLEKTARGSSINEKGNEWRDRVLRATRLNLIQYALPFNYVVTLTPDVGNMNPRVMMNYYKDWQTNRDTAHRLSKEIPHAIYNMDRDFGEAMQKLVGEGKMDAAKTKVARWGFSAATYVSQEFRTATFIDHYNTARAEGLSEASAAARADVVVRQQFGSTAIHDLPSIMTSGEPGRLLTMFYGFWNGQYNRMRAMPDNIRRGEYMDAAATAYGTVIVGTVMGAFIANPAKEEDSYLKRIAKAAPLHLLGQIPFLREGATLATEGIPPSTPHGSAMKAASAIFTDAKNYMQGKPIKSGVKHIAAAAGMAFGVPGTLQAGRTGQGLYDLAQGRQHPRNFMEYVRLLGTGEARLKRQGER